MKSMRRVAVLMVALALIVVASLPASAAEPVKIGHLRIVMSLPTYV